MRTRRLAIDDALELTPTQHGDARGLFLEWYQADLMVDLVGHGFPLAQANLSVSAQGVLRGIHFADVPPGQAKYVTCVRGAVLDVVVDLRQGSPTFGRWDSVRLDQDSRRAVYLPVGVGHGFCALTDDATLAYLCSSRYNPAVERTLHPLDPRLGISWPVERPRLSDRDAAAPSLAELTAANLLPDYEACLAYAETLRREQKNPPVL